MARITGCSVSGQRSMDPADAVRSAAHGPYSKDATLANGVKSNGASVAPSLTARAWACAYASAAAASPKNSGALGTPSRSPGAGPDPACRE